MDPSAPGLRAAKICVGAAVGAGLIVGIVEKSASRPGVSADLKHATSHSAGDWTATWGTGVQRPVAGDAASGADWSRNGFSDHSVRQVVRISAGGDRVRIRLSNLYGTRPLRVAGATVGRSGDGARVWPGSIQRVSFGRSVGAVVPAGREIVSDAVPVPVSPLERLAVTLRFVEPTGPATFHRFAMSTAYRASGDHLSDAADGAFTESSDSSYFLSGVEVAGEAGGANRAGKASDADADSGAVVVFGDSFVDGAGAQPGADGRFTDRLAERLFAARRPYGVVNAGIAGGRLLNGSECGGESGLSRFGRDVLARPGVRSVIVQLGAGDIGAPQADDPCLRPDPKVTAQRLIDGHRTLVRAAHARGVRAVGMTVPPLKGARSPFWNAEAEGVRQALNLWIRTGREYDAVVDADRALADPADPALPRPGYVAMGGLHPNEAGGLAIAAAVDLADI